MARKIARFAASEIYNRPQLIDSNGFAGICAYVEKRNNGLIWKQELEDQAIQYNKSLGWDKEGNWCCYEVENGIAWININGALTAKPTIYSMMCGGCSYSDLAKAASDIAEDPSISHVVLNLSSSGGQAYSCFDTAKYMKDTLKSAGKKIITYVDGTMASAAYALGCIGDEIIMNPDAQAGSIGVVIALHDEHLKEEMEGEKTIYIYAGESKVPFAEDGSFKQEFLDDLQADVNYTYGKFTSHVAEMRGLTEEAVIATQAKVFKTPDAISLGLADKEMTTFEFADYLSALINGEVEIPECPEPEIEDDEDHDHEEDSGCGKNKKKAETINNTIKYKEGEALEEQANVSVEATELAAQLADAKAQLAQMEELKAAAAELQALKQKAEQEAEAMRIQQQAELKQSYANMVASLGFVAEEKAESVADAIFAIRETNSEAAGLLIEQLETARSTIDAMKQNMCVEQGADTTELEANVDEQSRASKSLDEKIKQKYQQI